MPPTRAIRPFDLALQHHQAGRLREARQFYEAALATQPNHADALHCLGVLSMQLGQMEAAADLIRRAVAANPNMPAAYGNLGVALKGAGRIEQSLGAFRQAVVLDPSSPLAHFSLGNALAESGQLPGAIDAYRRAISLKPDYFEACSNLGIALEQTGNPEAAIAAFRQAIAANPDSAGARNNLANVLREKGLLDESITVYRETISLQADFAQAHNNLGNALKDAGELDEAVASYQKAVSLQPDAPDFHSNLIFALHYHPAHNARSIAAELHRWNVQHAQPRRKFIRPHANDRNPDRPLRIGYLSPDFRDHVVTLNLLPLLRHHDRSQFEITCYSHLRQPDAMTARVKETAARWREIARLSDHQVAEQIRNDQIDILVDLALHSCDNRVPIFAHKPAPVQVTFAGYPGTTGLTEIDYRLSDPYLDPTGMDESIYSERTMRLPDTFWLYQPLDCEDIGVGPLPALQTGTITFGCLNNFCKINDGVLELWANVLRQVVNSRLLLLASFGEHRQRTLNHLQDLGIDPKRIEFLAHQSRRAYLQQYHRIDIVLDSFPYNGHTTSLDSFWMGIPVVTLVGNGVVARAGWSQLSNLGLQELACESPDRFVTIATELARDLPRLQQLRSTLRQRMERSPLMNAPGFARDVEAAYRQMWRTYCAAVPSNA